MENLSNRSAWSTLTERIDAIPFRRLVWLLPIAFAVHEAEESSILRWYEAEFTNPPHSTRLALYVGLFTIALLGFLWTAVACRLPDEHATATMVLPFFVVLVFSNNLQHVYWTVAFGAYAPGVVTSALLGIPLTILVSWQAIRRGLASRSYVIILFVLCIPLLASTVAAGRTVFPLIQLIHNFFAWLVP
ncbi:MAG: HXXEE domain-containing protein [Sciscionella sp.]